MCELNQDEINNASRHFRIDVSNISGFDNGTILNG